MIDTKQLVDYAQHPELALQNLPDLMALLNGQDESAQSFATEALENCGPPGVNELPFLLKQLESTSSTTIYWASTLLGRMNATGNIDRRPIQSALCKVAVNEALDLSARERAVWAIGELGSMESACRERLSAVESSAAPRLKRLIATALAQ